MGGLAQDQHPTFGKIESAEVAGTRPQHFVVVLVTSIEGSPHVGTKVVESDYILAGSNSKIPLYTELNQEIIVLFQWVTEIQRVSFY